MDRIRGDHMRTNVPLFLSRALALVVLTALFAIVMAIGVEGATHVVDDDSGAWQDYAWIQDAINASTTGDSIEVYEGAYTGRLVIDEEVTITGNGTGTVFTATGAPAAGVYDIEIDASNVAIEEMLLDFNGPADGRGGQGIVVSDYDDPARNDVVIRDCTIYSGDGGGVGGTCIQTGKWADVTGLVVRDNIFYLDWDGLGEGVYINPHNGSGNHTVYNNEFYGYIFSAVSCEMGSVDVVGNTIDSNTSQGYYGVRMIDLIGGETYSGVTITGNDIQNVQRGIDVGTSSDVGSSLTVTATYNTLTSNDRGVRTRYGADLTVNYNSISGNTNYGIENPGGTSVDAEYNWWGDASGPSGQGSGSGDAVDTNVDFEPWYATATVTPSTEYVNVTYNPTRAVSDTIQGAIDAASSGDTVTVAVGTYYENPLVNKTLTLIGADRDTTVVDGGGSGDVMTVTSDDVEMTALNITNSGTGTWDTGILLDTVQDCHIWNVNWSGNHYGLTIDTCTGIVAPASGPGKPITANSGTTM